MKEESLIRKLGRRARLEAAPHVDVTDRVMAALRAESRKLAPRFDPLAWVAAASAAAAIVVVAAACSLGETCIDQFMVSRIDLPWWLL
jgi:hypothetical protein